MTDLYDRLENRTPAARESALLRAFRHIFALAKPRVPALRTQLRGIDIERITSRLDLAQIPIMRRETLVDLQKEALPFGGANATRVGALKQVFFGPGNLFSLEGQAQDWWGAGRALYAAGLRKADLMLNCFSYDLLPHGHMFAAGAAAIHSPVVPAGNVAVDIKVDLIRSLRPTFFCGRADEFKAIIDLALDREVSTSCIKSALLTGYASMGQRSEFVLREFAVRHAILSPEIGVIAFETDSSNRMTVNEGLIVEIVDPQTQVPLGPGQVGEIVVTRLNPDYPLLRYATDIRAAICEQPSSCGRTNMRLLAPRDPKPDAVVSNGRRIQRSDLRAILDQNPEVRRLSLVVRGNGERDGDEMYLRVEHNGPGHGLRERLSEALHKVTTLRGTVELLPPGTLSDDDVMIVDERPLN